MGVEINTICAVFLNTCPSSILKDLVKDFCLSNFFQEMCVRYLYIAIAANAIRDTYGKTDLIGLLLNNYEQIISWK